MYDGDYFKDIIIKDRDYVVILDEKNLDYYNSLTALRSNRCIFSDIGDFTLIDKMVNENTQVFEDNYNTELQWAGKTYRPRKLQK